MFALNTAVQSSTGISPAILNYGRQLAQPGSQRRHHEVVAQEQLQNESVANWHVRLQSLPVLHHKAAARSQTRRPSPPETRSREGIASSRRLRRESQPNWRRSTRALLDTRGSRVELVPAGGSRRDGRKVGVRRTPHAYVDDAEEDEVEPQSPEGKEATSDPHQNPDEAQPPRDEGVTSDPLPASEKGSTAEPRKATLVAVQISARTGLREARSGGHRRPGSAVLYHRRAHRTPELTAVVHEDSAPPSAQPATRQHTKSGHADPPGGRGHTDLPRPSEGGGRPSPGP